MAPIRSAVLCLCSGMTYHNYKEASKFLSVGAVNTILSLTVIFLTKWFFDLGDVIANILGYSFGFALSFILNSRWTFSYTGHQFTAALKFLMVALVAYSANITVVITLIQNTSLNSYIAQTLGVIPYTLISYFAYKYIVFRNKHA